MRPSLVLRCDPLIWIVRHLQGLLILALFWATVWDTIDWNSIGCRFPRRVDANLTCVSYLPPHNASLYYSTMERTLNL